VLTRFRSYNCRRHLKLTPWRHMCSIADAQVVLAFLVPSKGQPDVRWELREHGGGRRCERPRRRAFRGVCGFKAFARMATIRTRPS
jgi:hypothetical protein